MTTLHPSPADALKSASHGLRGTLAAELSASKPGGVSEAAYTLLKFHGSYEQFDRDTATPRKQAGLDKEWQYMVRIRAPGGMLTGTQYLALDAIAGRYANFTLKLTTRQGMQFHGTVLGDLKPEIAAINQALMTTYAACGDVVRNVMTTPAPRRDAIHARLQADAVMLSERLLPRSRGYYEIFLDEPPSEDAEPDPIYGDTYLPRKFKIGLIHPADNTVDVLANDLGFIAEFEGDTLRGYHVTVGGGHGMTHNNPATFPRLATPVGFVAPDGLWPATQAVVALFRAHGDRSNRRRARLKYVVEDRGIAWVRDQLIAVHGLDLQPARPLPALAIPELLGWHQQGDGRLWLGLPVPGGRIAGPLRTAIREAVERFGLDVVLTPQQDLLLSGAAAADRPAIDARLASHGITAAEATTPLARWALACTALPFCGLALTEAERARAPIVAALEAVLARHHVARERISLRIAGCPNGCSRPYAGDIGLVGRTPGHYAIFVGGDFEGTRLSFKLLERVPTDAIPDALDPLIAAWATTRHGPEGFGDFCTRLGPSRLLTLLPGASLAAD